MAFTSSSQAHHSLLIHAFKAAVPVYVEVQRNTDVAASVPTNQPNGGGVSSAQPWWSLDLILRPISIANSSGKDRYEAQSISHLGGRSLESLPLLFLNQCIDSMHPASSTTSETQQPTMVRFLFASNSGQVARCDFLERRLECCEEIAKATTFLSPLQWYAGVKSRQVTLASLLDTLPMAIGGLLLRNPGSKNPAAMLRHLDHELTNRLSFPWLLPAALPRRRIAWIQGLEDIDMSRRLYETAWALGISIVIMDHAGHWLQDENGPYAHLREAFIPVNIELDEGITQRIVDAVRRYPHPVDGVMTIYDVRLPSVAAACEVLGLPTSPSNAYAIAGDKAKTRMLEPGNDDSFILSNAEELPGYLSKRRGSPLPFPMIVKPCLGWSSDCVSKASNEAELAEAVRKASDRHANSTKRSTAVIVEPYIDGPEVDANFVLWDGEILFFEVCDDFPSNGDADDASPDDNFQETQVVLPTALPEQEIEALRHSLHQSILRQGFSSGIFHCEARVRHSSVHYTVQDGIVDLAEKTEPPSRHEVSIYLLENNARPPGYPVTVAAQLTYGIDYYALRFLLCVGSPERTRLYALAQPFLNGPQFALSTMLIPQTCVGVMKTADAGAEFLRRHPQLRDQIPDYKTVRKGGDILEGPSASSLLWIAYLSVFSRKSRRDCLRLVQFIRQNFSYELE